MRRFGILAALALLFLIACEVQTASTKQAAGARNDGDASTVNGEKTVAGVRPTRQDMEHMLEAQLHDFDSPLKALQTAVEKTRRKAKAQLNEAAKDIERELTVAKQQLEKVHAASRETWKNFKIKVSDKMDDLKHAYGRAIAELRKSV